MQVRALEVFPIEVIVRGHLVGGTWNEFVSPANPLSFLLLTSALLMYIRYENKGHFTALRSHQGCNAIRCFQGATGHRRSTSSTLPLPRVSQEHELDFLA
jgi:SAICAR synthetase